jgi:RNA polymerase sigma-70 factor (ECF subfamily)
VSTPSDLLLVQRASGGDVRAFEILVGRYQLSIVRLCVGMLGDRHAAEDAAQDAFFSAWRSMGRFRGDAQFSTWLYRIATNQCLRDIRRRPPQTAQLPEDLPAGEGGAPHSQLEAAEGVAGVSAAVARLSPEQRIALLLREIEGLSYDQIAEVLGVSMAAVKSRIYHARIELVRDLGTRDRTAGD